MVQRWSSSTVRSALAARKAPALRFCGETVRCGRRTRMASSWVCSPRKSRHEPAMIPAQHYDAVTRDLGKSFYQRIDAPASREQKKRLRRYRSQTGSMRRNWPASRSRKKMIARARQQSADRRHQGSGKERLVRRAAFRHGRQFTKFMPRVSGAKIICTRFKRTLRQPSGAFLTDNQAAHEQPA